MTDPFAEMNARLRRRDRADRMKPYGLIALITLTALAAFILGAWVDAAFTQINHTALHYGCGKC